MKTYIVRKPHKGDKKYQPGDKRRCSENTARKLQEKGLIFPNYVTKEDKNAYSATNKAYIHETSPGWYVVKKAGETISDKKHRKKDAIKLRDEINQS